MWPFNKPEEPDNREPSNAALAIAHSLATEPLRWKFQKNYNTLLCHDSGVTVDTNELWITAPWTTNEPDANEAVLEEAIDKWIANRLACPVDPPPAAES